MGCKDGFEDAIVIFEYTTGIAHRGAQLFLVVTVYFNSGGKSFLVYDGVNEKIAKTGDKTISDVLFFLYFRIRKIMTTTSIIMPLLCLIHFYTTPSLSLIPPLSSKIVTGEVESSLLKEEMGKIKEKLLSTGATSVKFALAKQGISSHPIKMKIQRKRIDLIQQLLLRRSCTFCDLKGVNLSGANLINVKLFGANLSGADISQANLSLANLSHANLTGANLSKANLSFVNLTDADLTRANLSNVELRGAILDRVNMTGANLTGVNLTGVNLSGVRLCATLMPDGYISRQGCN